MTTSAGPYKTETDDLNPPRLAGDAGPPGIGEPRADAGRPGRIRPVFSLMQALGSADNRTAVTGAFVASVVTAGILVPLLVIQGLTGLTVFTIPYIASAAAIALAPAAPLVRPRAITIGYAVAVPVALVITAPIGASMYAAALAVTASIVIMILLKAPHVPAVAAAALIGLNDPGVIYVLDPLIPAVAAVILATLALARYLPNFNYQLSWR